MLVNKSKAVKATEDTINVIEEEISNLEEKIDQLNERLFATDNQPDN